MTYFPGLSRASALLLLAAAQLGWWAPSSFAVDTHVWEQSGEADFERGTNKHLAIRSDGRVTLSPAFEELASSGVPYLWAVAQDRKGTLYYAGGAPTGATAKVFALEPGGKPRVLAELSGLEVHALAVDAQSRVYAAVLPDAKIYQIDAAGKSKLFFDPKCKYVWSLAFDKAGNLFAATGEDGLIYKIAPDGNGAKFFDTQETHARSMVIDGEGNLIVGTEPGGLVLRITPEGHSFVLYQANKREVTAVAERDGMIYAAAIGAKPGGVTVRGTAPVLPTATTSPVTATGVARAGAAPPRLPPAIGSLTASVTGGSEFYRIQKDGFAERLWESSSALIYAIAFDPAGEPLLGTGNKGVIYRIDSDDLSTELLNAPPTQVTALLQGRNGIVYAATGNVGNVYSIGPRLEKSGTLDSEVLDAGEFAYWGKIHVTPNPKGSSVALETRSGNLNNPENSWSPWGKVPLSELGGAVSSPPARFLQYRLTLAREEADTSPEVSTIDIPYLPKNVSPKIQQVAVAPFNYRQPPSSTALERNVTASGSPTTLTLPAVGQRRSSGGALTVEAGGSATLQYGKGFLTVRWAASDSNGDPLLFQVELRDANGGKWQLLKDKLSDRFYAFDTTAFPDGQYVARVTASDAPGNTASNALSSSLESDPFVIDNTPPAIENVSVSPGGADRVVKFTARDALSWIDKAEFSVDGGEWNLLEPDHHVTDSQLESYQVSGHAGQGITVRVFDEDDNVVVRRFELR